MKFGVIIFPGSNCDHDAHWTVGHVAKQPVTFLWHDSHDLQNCDAIIVPGGFAFGDYLRTGAIAKFSPVMESVRKFADRGGLVLGICNGFQILCEAGLLPGALIRNSSLEYRCMTCELAVEDAGPSFNPKALGARIRLPIGHGEGNYRIDEAGRARLSANGQVLLRYVGNPNGSLDDIAGVRNEAGNVFGMMPHPDRAFERFHPSQDGLAVARAVLAARFPEIAKKSA